MTRAAAFSILMVKAAGHLVAVPTNHVIEVMRVLPIEALAGAPTFVRGLAVIRGRPVPVVDLEALLGGAEPGRSSPADSARLVTLRVGERTVALLVDAVLSFRSVEEKELQNLPPLWADAMSPAVGALARLDRELIFVLEATKLVPIDWWQTNEAGRRTG